MRKYELEFLQFNTQDSTLGRVYGMIEAMKNGREIWNSYQDHRLMKVIR
jgi:hypothetical protein